MLFLLIPVATYVLRFASVPHTTGALGFALCACFDTCYGFEHRAFFQTYRRKQEV